MTIKPISATHTMNGSFHGTTISATAQELVAAFGKPVYGNNDGQDKVNLEWCLQLDGEPFTIYDWKLYRSIHPTEYIEWHIGGKSQAETSKACQAMSQILDNKPAAANPYVDMNYQDRTSEIEARFHATVDDMKRDPELYAELVNDLLYHWIYGTRETLMMNMFKSDILKPKL